MSHIEEIAERWTQEWSRRSNFLMVDAILAALREFAAEEQEYKHYNGAGSSRAEPPRKYAMFNNLLDPEATPNAATQAFSGDNSPEISKVTTEPVVAAPNAELLTALSKHTKASYTETRLKSAVFQTDEFIRRHGINSPFECVCNICEVARLSIGRADRLTALVAELAAANESIRRFVVPQELANDNLQRLDAAGMGKPGAKYGNTLTGMVQEACEQLAALVADNSDMQHDITRLMNTCTTETNRAEKAERRTVELEAIACQYNFKMIEAQRALADLQKRLEDAAGELPPAIQTDAHHWCGKYYVLVNDYDTLRTAATDGFASRDAKIAALKQELAIERLAKERK